MKKYNKSVFGIFKDKVSLERAVELLKSDNFSNNDISVLFADNQSTRTFAHQKETKAPEGAAAGASTGVVLGSTLGWLVGVGSLAIPGVGPFIAAGPIMAALAGMGVGGVIGGISGALIGLGIPEYEAKRYGEMVNNGGILLSVHCSGAKEAKRAEDILKRVGAHDVAMESEIQTGDKVANEFPKVANM